MPKETKYVLIIGSSNMDLNIYSKRFPNPGETVMGGVLNNILEEKVLIRQWQQLDPEQLLILLGK